MTRRRPRRREDIRREWRFAGWGALIGTAIAVAAGLAAAIQSKNFWFRFEMAAGEVGLATVGLGAIIGSLISLAMESKQNAREASDHCQTCGYNLTGNTSGRCPECGAMTESQ